MMTMKLEGIHTSSTHQLGTLEDASDEARVHALDVVLLLRCFDLVDAYAELLAACLHMNEHVFLDSFQLFLGQCLVKRKLTSD